GEQGCARGGAEAARRAHRPLQPGDRRRAPEGADRRRQRAARHRRAEGGDGRGGAGRLADRLELRRPRHRAQGSGAMTSAEIAERTARRPRALALPRPDLRGARGLLLPLALLLAWEAAARAELFQSNLLPSPAAVVAE